jgi:two-component system, NtrC family, sensor kinase
MDKILICDDNELNIVYISTIIKKEDRIILVASSGEEALIILEENRDTSLILMDIQMPGMNGYDTVKIIKGKKEFEDVPIIFVTGVFKSESNVNFGFEIGAYDYIFKPFERHEIENKVNIFLTLYNQRKLLIEQNLESLAQKEFLSKVISSVPSLLLVLNEKKEIITSNDSIFQLKERFQGITPEDIIRELNDDIDECFNNVLAILKEIVIERGHKTEDSIQKINNISENSEFRIQNSELIKYYFNAVISRIGIPVLENKKSVNGENHDKEFKHILLTITDITERKQSEVALKESEEKFKSIYEGSNDAIMLLNNNGFFDCNLRTLEIFGIDNIEDFIKFHPAELSPPSQPDGRNSFDAATEKILTAYQKGMNRFDWVHRRSNGEDFPAEVLLSAFYLRGEIVLHATVRDITERKHAEEALRQTETILSTISNSAKDGIIMMNNVGNISFWNPASESIFGYSATEALGKNLHELIVPEGFRQIHTEVFPKWQKTGEGAAIGKTLELSGIRKDGQEFPVELSLSSAILNDKWIAVGIVRDITIRKQFEETLIKNKAMITEAQRIGGLGSWEYDIEKRVFTLSDNMYRILDIEPAEEHLLEFEYFIEKIVHADDKQNIILAFNTSISNGSSFELNYRIVCRDGSLRYIHSKADIICNIEGLPIKMIGSVQDVTERIKLETQNALSQKMESVGQLAAGIAHEINTPMQFVGDNTYFIHDAFKSYIEYINYVKEYLSKDFIYGNRESAVKEIKQKEEEMDIDYLNKEVPVAIERTQNGIARVSKIVLAMKNFSHPSQKQKSSANINQGVDVTVTISRNEWKYVAEMETKLDPELPLIHCCMDEINQVLLNMVVNAAHTIGEKIAGNKEQGEKSTDLGKISIETLGAGDFIEILISDTGCGIPADKISRIWEPFYTTKEVGKGTGQGLAIAHDIIVNKHNGEILVDSAVGQGTTFTIRLPIK